MYNINSFIDEIIYIQDKLVWLYRSMNGAT